MFMPFLREEEVSPTFFFLIVTCMGAKVGWPKSIPKIIGH